MQQWTRESAAMTFDDAYMERSKSFVKALQELKNLRPQLYSAAEYCEKSYLHNEQKQMVLDNLKDYTVRALVNAVDHLGTVAYKLTDLFEQQTVDISTMELKICCLNQRIFTCRTYMDLEGLRQQQMSTISTKHHKQYILPNSDSRKFQSNLQLQTDARQNAIQARPRPQPPGTPAIKTLSWHIASETNTTPNGASIATSSNGDSKASKRSSEVFHLLDTEETAAPLPSSTHFRTAGGTSIPNVPPRTLGLRGSLEVSKPLSAFRSFDNPGRLDVYRPPARSKSMLSVFFTKNKTLKQKKTSAT